METEKTKPGKFWAFVAVVVGAFLILAGLLASMSYLGLPMFIEGDALSAQLGTIAAIFLGIICGSLAAYHGIASVLNRRSGEIHLPPVHFFILAFTVVLGLGNVILAFEIGQTYLFPPLFLLGAALPTIGVVAWATRRLAFPITWRQGSLALVCGSTLSIVVTFMLAGILPFFAFLFIAPLGSFADSILEFFNAGTPRTVERILFSPDIGVFLIGIALQAPIPEELAKALALPIFGRLRVTTEQMAFSIGLASGAGFAILENMLYEGVYAQWSGWTWGGVTALRAIGSVMHPLCTGIVALGWFRVPKHGIQSLLKAYLAAVLIHTFWNGGFDSLVFITGVDLNAGPGTFSVYGTATEILLVIYLLGLSLGLWLLLRRIVGELAEGDVPSYAPIVASRRAIAVWGLICAAVIIPLGAALGPALSELTAVMLGR